MRLRHHVASLSVVAALSGCAGQAPDTTSHISGATFRDTSALTVFIADILANSMDARQSTIRLLPYSGADTSHAAILLSDTLRERGFALSPDGMRYPGAHDVRYAVSPVGQNLLLELDVDDADATCLYGHDGDGALQRVGSCTLRAGSALTLRIPRTGPAGIPVLPATTPGVATPPPVEIWSLVEGQPIRDQMIAWGDRAGWKVIWPHSLNWTVPAMTSFSGDFVKIMGDVVRTIADEGKSIHADFHPSNRMLVVTSPGGDSR
ncbi:toxin co-regulated pilus biosynthesis Q family protein [Komagataeibacter sp. FNDCR2]|uniref:toxin co-regulated pilus biosynthesis Q family protein n=1 Tax=Komagataeibacter sp. FNDCR2 TaxID=2878682 RepID=UPI001E2E26CF|nr:toxin co-regulated pilus biosynthesis Q family protein [Komagataeibacter sp. FNDCR2]MCE2576666.1 toxin co-regulated pilus biosynthesis Q family protein [Komagataeibacter sp. FNDCR2]